MNVFLNNPTQFFLFHASHGARKEHLHETAKIFVPHDPSFILLEILLLVGKLIGFTATIIIVLTII